MENRNHNFSIGIITAGGTGSEVSDILQTVINHISSEYALMPQWEKFVGKPKTFWELQDRAHEKAEIEERETQQLVAFCRDSYQKGCKTIFQTATNAGTLYQQRLHLELMKLMHLHIGSSQIILTREQSQGFYGIDHKKETDSQIQFTCSYSKEKLYRTWDESIQYAEKSWKDSAYSIRIVYKYHLFDLFDGWFKEYVSKRNYKDRDIELVQPDTGYDFVVTRIPKNSEKNKKLLLIVANEIGDIFTEALPNHYGIGHKADMFAWNLSLDSQTAGQAVYQTIHGSADSIAGKHILNPFATIKAAAHILETRAGLAGIYPICLQAITKAEHSHHITPDLGGRFSTEEVLDFVIQEMKEKHNETCLASH